MGDVMNWCYEWLMEQMDDKSAFPAGAAEAMLVWDVTHTHTNTHTHTLSIRCVCLRLYGWVLLFYHWFLWAEVCFGECVCNRWSVPLVFVSTPQGASVLIEMIALDIYSFTLKHTLKQKQILARMR